MSRANEHANYLSVKIAAPELTKKTVDVTNYIEKGRDQEAEEERVMKDQVAKFTNKRTVKGT